jgi:hypothetical protein
MITNDVEGNGCDLIWESRYFSGGTAKIDAPRSSVRFNPKKESLGLTVVGWGGAQPVWTQGEDAKKYLRRLYQVLNTVFQPLN